MSDVFAVHDYHTSCANNDTSIILQQMLDACTSVTKTALACPTLGSFSLRQISDGDFDDIGSNDDDQEAVGRNSTSRSTSKEVQQTSEGLQQTVTSDLSAEYADELEIGKWLDSQIVEYRAALKRQEEEDRLWNLGRETAAANKGGVSPSDKGDAAEDDTSVANTAIRKVRAGSAPDAITIRRKERELKRLREDVFDETVRLQQERLLLSRLRMSAAAVYTSFPDSTTAKRSDAVSNRTCDANDEREASSATSINDEEDHAARIRREALRSRDGQVSKALGRIQKVDKLRYRLAALSTDCRQWQSKNRDLWKRLTTNAAKSDTNDVLVASFHGQARDTSSIQSLQRENLVLRRALVEAIAGSGIDWYGDEKLSKTIQELEEC